MATRRKQTQTASTPKSMPANVVTGTGPTNEERVRRYAYLLFEERQHAGVAGDPLSDWLRAECELRAASRQPQWTRPS
ncbi:MAG: DUF2934 domain-containing protein [Phycisphaerae bacterium]|nr:DUF2934 domain-containing protein [Phycisphaerae bacterium]